MNRADLSKLTDAEKDALITTLLKRIEELEARLGLPAKTPGNSSLPPSKGNKPSDPVAAKPKVKPHAGANRPLHPNPTSKRDVLAHACQHCGADVSGTGQMVCEEYDRVEIAPIVPDVTRVALHGGVCPCCSKRFKAAPPEGLEAGSPYGSNLRAFVIYLRSVQGIALARLSTLMHDLFGLSISEGALVNILRASAAPFAAQTARISAELKSSTVLASDETGLRIGKTNGWLWVFHHGASALFRAAASRAKTVVADFLGDHRPDYWLSDRYGAQMGWARREHQVCLAHLIRDVQYAIDAGETQLAPGLKGLLKRACAIGRRRPGLADATLKTYQADLDRRLDRIMAVTPMTKRGVKLHAMIRKTRRHLFVFLTNRQIEPTNNGSERALRPCTVYRKITNGFRAKWAADLYADTRSAVETGRRRAIRAIDAIRLTLANQQLIINQ